MAKLTAKRRNALPASEFAGPNRSYPVPDASHARNAKARASEMEHRGRISKATEEKIDAKADRKLGKHNDGDADDKPQRRARNPEGNPGYHASTKAYEHEGREHTSKDR